MSGFDVVVGVLVDASVVMIPEDEAMVLSHLYDALGARTWGEFQVQAPEAWYRSALERTFGEEDEAPHQRELPQHRGQTLGPRSSCHGSARVPLPARRRPRRSGERILTSMVTIASGNAPLDPRLLSGGVCHSLPRIDTPSRRGRADRRGPAGGSDRGHAQRGCRPRVARSRRTQQRR